LVLNGNFSALTTNQYEAIEEFIATQVKKDRSHITINALREGSIFIDATINADNIADQSQLMTNLQTSLTTGASIAGFTVQSAGLVANSDAVTTTDDSEANKQRNIAIILGIVIPICVSNYFLILVIIIIVLIILYRKGIICSSSNKNTTLPNSTIDEIKVIDPKSFP
jgi:hypothetical protein